MSFYTFTETMCDQTLEVVFDKIECSVSLICSTGGATDISGSVDVKYGSDFTVHITPLQGYEIDFVKVNGAPVESSLALTVSYITADTVIEVVFRQATFTVHTSASEHGTVTPTFSSSRGKSYSVVFTPDSWYKVKDVVIDGVSVGAVDTYMFFDVDSDHSVQVYYELDKTALIIICIASVALIGLVSVTVVAVRMQRKHRKQIIRARLKLWNLLPSGKR